MWRNGCITNSSVTLIVRKDAWLNLCVCAVRLVTQLYSTLVTP